MSLTSMLPARVEKPSGVDGELLLSAYEGPICDCPDWSFWSDEARLGCVSYNSQIDEDMLNVLKGVAANKFNDDIAKATGLLEQYVELLQSILCSADWGEYGGSPRGCWPNVRGRDDKERGANAAKLVARYEEYFERKWGDGRTDPAPWKTSLVGVLDKRGN